jgi:hypothetical protein
LAQQVEQSKQNILDELIFLKIKEAERQQQIRAKWKTQPLSPLPNF